MTPPDAPPVVEAPPDAAPIAEPPDAAPAPVAPGTLSVRVKPWAHVFVDGVQQRDTPLDLKLPPGRHEVRVTNDALAKDETLRIDVVSGETSTVAKRWDE